ncbi:retrovirus-related pol polyprotein from transposon TNT 1-94 [Tanacetum coccineum]|uniref:Retrovirus-related pol polyprotein from transposon TNT 1-94 n=1 Tax=Tanacetum coccineum TaxID=301880 RepID=A0ABQ4Z2H4_9ASTR
MASNEETNAAGTDTRPPMLVESDYDSWKIRIHRYIRGKPNGKQIWKSIQNGPTPHPMITDPPPTDSDVVPGPRKKLDSEFSEEENKLEMADTQAEIILSQGLPRHRSSQTSFKTSTAKEIWDNVEMLMQGSGRTIQQRKEDLFDEYERFRAIGNESIHDYFVRFHKLVNDMKITQLNIPTHQMNTKFVNNLPAYWGKYVTNVKQNMDISTTPYVQIFTHRKPTSHMPKKTLRNKSLRTSSNSRTHATVHDGHIVTEPVQRKAPGNVGNTGARGKKVICYNCRGEGHVARQCKEPKRKMDSQYFKDKALLMEAKEKEMQLTTTNMFQANHEDELCSDFNEVTLSAIIIFDNVDYQLSQEMHQEEHLDSDAETEIDDNTIPYHQYLLDTEAQMFQLSEEVLVHQVVSMKKMNEKPGHIRPANGFYDKLNALMFVPQKDLSGDQRIWIFWPTIFVVKIVSKLQPTAATPFVRKVEPQVKFMAVFESLMLLFLNLKFVEQQLVPFYDHFKKNIQAANDTFFKEIKEFEQIFDELEAEYEQCVLDNKNLTIEKKNLLIINECLIAEIVLEKDIYSIVLSSDIVVPPSSNCLCEDLRSACDREHTKVLELEAEISKTETNSFLNTRETASNAIFEINKLRQQLQGKDDTIRNLDAQINIMKVLNVGSTEGSCDQQALETDRIQLKDTITSLRIQLDGLKVENVSLKRRYDELSKANNHSRIAYTEKLSAFTAENTKLKAQVTGTTSSGPSTSEKPKVLASGMYTNSSKYIPPPKRANWVKPTPLPKKKQVTFQEPPRTSNRPTQKPPVQQNKKPNVPVNLSTRTKPATESRKPMPKSHTRNHRILPSKSVNARRAADHNRKLNVVDHNQFVIRSLKSVNTKTPQAKHSVNHTKKVWKATRNHNVNTTKTAWRPTGNVVGSVKP